MASVTLTRLPPQDWAPPCAVIFWGGSPFHTGWASCRETFHHIFSLKRWVWISQVANFATEAKGILPSDIREEQDRAQESFKLGIFSISSKGRIRSSLLQLDMASPRVPSFHLGALPCDSRLARAGHHWINVPRFKQTGHRSQVKLELEESVYALKMVPLFSLAGAANKTSLLSVCCAPGVLSLLLFKGWKCC